MGRVAKYFHIAHGLPLHRPITLQGNQQDNCSSRELGGAPCLHFCVLHGYDCILLHLSGREVQVCCICCTPCSIRFYAACLAESSFLGEIRVFLWVYRLMGGDWSGALNWVSFWLRTGVTAQVESVEMSLSFSRFEATSMNSLERQKQKYRV